MSKRRYYYTKWDIFVSWLKKKLGIKSPGTIWITGGKYEYEYDRITHKKGAD